MGTSLSTSSRFLISDVVEVLEATRMFRGDRSGSIRALTSNDGWSEAALYIGADDRLHVVMSVPPGPDSSVPIGEVEVRLELVVDPQLGATRVARMLLAAAGLDAEGQLD